MSRTNSIERYRINTAEMLLTRRNRSSDIRTSSPSIRKSNGSGSQSEFSAQNHHQGKEKRMKLTTQFFLIVQQIVRDAKTNDPINTIKM